MQVVSNIPFNISTEVVKLLLPMGDIFSEVVLLLQVSIAPLFFYSFFLLLFSIQVNISTFLLFTSYLYCFLGIYYQEALAFGIGKGISFSFFFFFFLISNKNILKRRRVSPEYTGSIHQGQKQIKCIK